MRPLLPSSSSNSSGCNIQVRRRRIKKRVLDSIKKETIKNTTAVATFQKKLVVFTYMGLSALSTFTHKDCNILLRGLLPEIPVNQSE